MMLSACHGSDGDANISGLDSRPSNPHCIAPPRPTASSNIQLMRVYQNLSFNSPLLMLQEATNSNRWYVVEKGGRVAWFNANDETTTQKNTYLDIASIVDSRGEGGLLSMAFHPNFTSNQQVFLSYTIDAVADIDNQMISRFTRLTESTSGNELDTTTEMVILEQNQFATNHNGGHIAFGPDSFLYIGLGDGGGGGDPEENSQDTNTLLGSLLRIDIDSATPYAIPTDNPFFASGGRAEIFAYGLRNPWRWSFDRSNGDLWLGDVGQNAFEEVNLIINGGNYGWDCYEANASFEITGCPSEDQVIFPIAEYSRAEGVSITGGYVYRGSNIPSLQGVYVFGDFGSGTVWGLYPQADNTYERRLLLSSGLNIASFAQGNDGELFVVDLNGGLYSIIEQTTATPSSGPAKKLSETGCVDASNPMLPAAGVIAYTVNDSFWSDAAHKTRYLAIPDGTTIKELPNTDFEFPINSVLIKNFSLAGQIVETRLLVRHNDGGWAGYSYEWNDALTDADLVAAAGKDKTINGQLWRYPSHNECLLCHTAAAGFSLGTESVQLNGDFSYPTSGKTANQLTTLAHIGMFDAPLSTAAKSVALVNSQTLNEDLGQRARSYLHSNCANCHQPGGTTQSNLDFRFSTAFKNMNMCNVNPQQGDLGISQAKLLVPGMPQQSILIERIRLNNQNRMPPIGSNVLDTMAITLLSDWVSAISNCN